jgi:hypothetical protein
VASEKAADAPQHDTCGEPAPGGEKQDQNAGRALTGYRVTHACPAEFKVALCLSTCRLSVCRVGHTAARSRCTRSRTGHFLQHA